MKRKKSIQKEFWTKMGLQVDKVRPGFGNTNDGNTARRYFNSPEESAAILGIDPSLVSRFAVILAALSTTQEIDSSKYKE